MTDSSPRCQSPRNQRARDMLLSPKLERPMPSHEVSFNFNPQPDDQPFTVLVSTCRDNNALYWTAYYYVIARSQVFASCPSMSTCTAHFAAAVSLPYPSLLLWHIRLTS